MVANQNIAEDIVEGQFLVLVKLFKQSNRFKIIRFIWTQQRESRQDFKQAETTAVAVMIQKHCG